MAVPLPKRRFTVAEYYRMAETGILSHEGRVELIEGEVVQKVPIGSRHAGCVNYVSRQLQRLLDDRAIVAVQNPLRLGDISEPDPDLSLLRPRADDYRTRHPRAADTLLVIEVSKSSVEADRTVKGLLYARAGIPEFWLVDLVVGAIEVYRAPQLSGWGEQRVAHVGEKVTPAAFPEVQLDVAEALG